MTTAAANGKIALDNRDYATAVAHLTTALQQVSSPLWLIQRSTAYHRLEKYELALADADSAVLAATERARRELIATAQFRRAVALHGLKRYGDARLCLTWCRQLNEKETGLGMWQAKVKKDYDNAGGEDAGCNKCVVSQTPDKSNSSKKSTKKEDQVKTENPQKGKSTASLEGSSTPRAMIRNEWFQSGSKVSVIILAKQIPKEKAKIKIEENSLSISFPIVGDSPYEYTIDPFFSKVDVLNSSFVVTPHKIEVNLHKSVQSLKWSTLERKESTAPASQQVLSSIPPGVAEATTAAKSPAYPTSSRNGPKDWDALASSALKAEGGSKDGTTGQDDVDGDGEAVDDFFKMLYKDADPDTRRAMMKSFQESNGTTLSTNWAEVSKGPVETHPPDGLVAKKW